MASKTRSWRQNPGIYDGACYRFLPSSARDHPLFKNRERLSRVVQISSPLSTSDLPFLPLAVRWLETSKRSNAMLVMCNTDRSTCPSSALLIPLRKLFYISTLSGSHDAVWRSSSAAAAQRTYCGASLRSLPKTGAHY
jgi:hypothetical protein